MKSKKRYLKVLSIIVFVLSIGSLSWIVYGNDQKDITYTLHEELLNEGTEAILTLEVMAATNSKITSIQLPDGSIVENQTSITYLVLKNGDYTFLVNYINLVESNSGEIVTVEKTKEIVYQEMQLITMKVEKDSPNIKEESINQESNKAPETYSTDIIIDQTTFPDPIFRTWLENQSYGLDKRLTEQEILAITEINVNKNTGALESEKIKSLKGIEYFPNIKKLYCANNLLTTLDISKNTNLTDLQCHDNRLTALDVSMNKKLTYLHCYNNQISVLDVSQNKGLKYLYCQNNKITSMDVSVNTALLSLYCNGNQITNLLLGTNTVLTYLRCQDNQLSTIDITKNTGLEYFYCNNNALTELNVTNNSILKNIHCSKNQLTTLDISKNTTLKSVLMDNQTKNISMFYNNNQWQSATNYVITKINESNTNIQYNSSTGQFSSTTGATKSNTFTTDCIDGNGNTYSLSGTLYFMYDGLEINETNFPDTIFRNWLLDKNNINGYGKDTIFTDSELIAIQEIYVGSKGIGSLKGIEYFTNLKTLYCFGNALTELDISKNTALQDIQCHYNKLKNLDVSKNTKLVSLRCDRNELTTIDISYNIGLKHFWCYSNNISTLDVSKNVALKSLYCYDNSLSTLDISKNILLEDLRCYSNNLTELNVTANTALVQLQCNDNHLTTINLSKNTKLSSVQAHGQTINIMMYFANNSWKSDSTIKYVVGTISNSTMTYNSATSQFISKNAVVKSSDFTTDCIDGTGTYRTISGNLSFHYDGFISVQNISNVSKLIRINEPLLLTGTIEPSNATENTIAWSIKTDDTSGATLINGYLTVQNQGKVVITATVLGGNEKGNYTQDFTLVTYQEPSTLVLIPSSITLEKVKNDETIEALKEETISILSSTDTNVYEDNFYVKTDPSFPLLNTVNSDEWFTVQVYDQGNNMHTSKDSPLAILNSNTKSQRFYIKALKDVKRQNGIYQGTMNFIIGYGTSQ